MTTKSNCIRYVCIARETTVLAEFNSMDAELSALAAKCLENKPSNHLTKSHTVNGKTYTFLFDDHLVYFVIHVDSLEKDKGIAYLSRVKESFEKFKGDSLITASSHCFQDEFYHIFRQLLPQSNEYAETQMERKKNLRHDGSENLDSIGGDYLKMVKKRASMAGSGGEVGEDEQVNSDNSSVMNNKKELFRGDAGQRDRRGWRKHVWFVLSMDLIIFCILFAVWLWT